jgi:hypothetical protein
MLLKIRQQLSVNAVKSPVEGYVWVIVVSTAGRLAGSNA